MERFDWKRDERFISYSWYANFVYCIMAVAELEEQGDMEAASKYRTLGRRVSPHAIPVLLKEGRLDLICEAIKLGLLGPTTKSNLKELCLRTDRYPDLMAYLVESDKPNPDAKQRQFRL